MAVKWDVAILGGGFAGQLFARQLTRQVPGLRIGVFERSTERSFKVGEATVEIGANYLVRRQGLLRYLYDRHYPKNGLRYFFDNEAKSTPLQNMSEIGPVPLNVRSCTLVVNVGENAALLILTAPLELRSVPT